ncbi:hypothetical protein Ari01nite_49660 [Paractinoplanes rishiriensis]|uniref:SnoaL-like domain-containing protein n=1 Tax=Paractinoplanes rishiriensis TaxID=1050105 RepID=A0A919JYD5_9ACTN|nr:hypothetical protein Ari01nite_49660 [Actinoplanes rishiriensis]
MTEDERLVTELVEGWVSAIVARDLEGVVAGHASDVVMFDVPPPDDGVRGLAAYRETWPPFFKFLESGAVFELDRLEVTAGAEVAYAHALLRCGNPPNRLRVTVGLRQEDGRWVIAHEHHSFPLAD